MEISFSIVLSVMYIADVWDVFVFVRLWSSLSSTSWRMQCRWKSWINLQSYFLRFNFWTNILLTSLAYSSIEGYKVSLNILHYTSHPFGFILTLHIYKHYVYFKWIFCILTEIFTNSKWKIQSEKKNVPFCTCIAYSKYTDTCKYARTHSLTQWKINQMVFGSRL